MAAVAVGRELGAIGGVAGLHGHGNWWYSVLHTNLSKQQSPDARAGLTRGLRETGHGPSYRFRAAGKPPCIAGDATQATSVQPCSK